MLLPLSITIIIIHHRINHHFVIKISDFGLTEDVYARNYFRQAAETAIKLPVKWMAPESFQDKIFSEKSDVVCISMHELYLPGSPKNFDSMSAFSWQDKTIYQFHYS